MSSHQSGIKDLFFNSSVCRNLTMAEDRFCENDGDKSIIDKNIYPAMESTCLRPCTQVNVLKRMIVFKKKLSGHLHSFCCHLQKQMGGK